jgi:hypothetical protein
MIGVCLLCGKPADAKHHVTWRGRDGRYLDPAFRVPLCHSCHELMGEDRWTEEGTNLVPPQTFLDSLELRLRRAATFLGRLAANVCGPLGDFLAQLAKHLASWAVQLADALAAFDRYSPGWRAFPGV